MKQYVTRYPQIKIKKNSTTYSILEFSKFYARKIKFIDLQHMNPSKYKTERSIQRSILSLKLHNLIECYDDNSWEITSKGIAVFYDISNRTPNYLESKD
jgi:hypothetical protein